MSTTVYVVMASEGEYSERQEWVCGVFADPEHAKTLVAEKMAEVRAAVAAMNDWDSRHHYECGTAFRSDPGWQARDARFKAVNGERPEYLLEADAFWAVAVPMETWGKWDTWIAPEGKC